MVRGRQYLTAPIRCGILPLEGAMQLAEGTAPVEPGIGHIEHIENDDVLYLYLEVPPSVNRLYLKGKFGNKYRNPALLQDEGEQVASIRQTARGWAWRARVPVKMEIILHWNQAGKRRRDLDNILKVLLDRLAKAIGVDDDWFHDIHLMKEPTRGESFVRVRIWGECIER